MGNCDSSIESMRLKHSSRQNISKDYKVFSSNFSSSSLPSVSSSFNMNQESQESSHNHKRNNSIVKNNPLSNKQYLLPERIAKREDITKKYRISKKVIGDGATSLVYLGENKAKEKFALKRIFKEKISSRHNIMEEAEILFKLKHKNIIKYYEIYEDINFINIVMELGDTDLFELIVNSPLGIIPEDLAIDFLIQIFEAIDYLHNAVNIVHCDIKPENFVVKYDKKTEKFVLKLCDFGNSRNRPINKERLFNFCGTKEYMPPEALEDRGFNEKVDEWAAGIIMYNMLTGADPFSSSNDLEYRDNIKFKEINFNYIKNEDLRELNKKLLNRFMAKRISAREALEEIKKIKKNYNINNNIKGIIEEKNFVNIIVRNKISLMNIS